MIADDKKINVIALPLLTVQSGVAILGSGLRLQFSGPRKSKLAIFKVRDLGCKSNLRTNYA